MNQANYLFLQPLPPGVILVMFHKGFCQAVMGAIREGVTVSQLSAHCGISETVLTCIIRRELGLKRERRE